MIETLIAIYFFLVIAGVYAWSAHLHEQNVIKHQQKDFERRWGDRNGKRQ